MRFTLTHLTHYAYASPASESFMEARLTPVNDSRQRLLERTLELEPFANVHRYVDYFGNAVETFSIIHRHRELKLLSTSVVETQPACRTPTALALTVSEARQIYHGDRLGLLEWLVPTEAVPFGPGAAALSRRFFSGSTSLGEALDRLMRWIQAEFVYAPGSTTVATPVEDVLQARRGVCQDFAQVMLALARSAGVPARYVTGYIETETQRKISESPVPRLVGASESHAWVELFLPDGTWHPLDPTNACVAGERHVKVACGRDYLDTSPTRGVFKGTHSHQLQVSVFMRR